MFASADASTCILLPLFNPMNLLMNLCNCIIDIYLLLLHFDIWNVIASSVSCCSPSKIKTISFSRFSVIKSKNMVGWSSFVRPAAQFAKYRAILQSPVVQNGKLH